MRARRKYTRGDVGIEKATRKWPISHSVRLLLTTKDDLIFVAQVKQWTLYFCPGFPRGSEFCIGLFSLRKADFTFWFCRQQMVDRDYWKSICKIFCLKEKSGKVTGLICDWGIFDRQMWISTRRSQLNQQQIRFQYENWVHFLTNPNIIIFRFLKHYVSR